jgi:hypothetical protein
MFFVYRIPVAVLIILPVLYPPLDTFPFKKINKDNYASWLAPS